jgi:hypothetical protein
MKQATDRWSPLSHIFRRRTLVQGVTVFGRKVSSVYETTSVHSVQPNDHAAVTERLEPLGSQVGVHRGPGEAPLLGPVEGMALEAAPLPEVDDEGPQVRRGDLPGVGSRPVVFKKPKQETYRRGHDVDGGRAFFLRRPRTPRSRR